MEKNAISSFCKRLPKVELHAHLNGSLSTKTLRELHELHVTSHINDASWNIWEAVIEHGQKRTLDECFQLFGIAHSLTSTPCAIYKATQDVVREFADDGVLYLELRSTPRTVPGVMSKAEYIQAMMDAIRDVTDCQIQVKLIVSIDRRQGKEAANETFNVTLAAHRQNPNIIVGMDLSGDPSKGDITDYLSIFDEARKAGFKLSLHCAEVPNTMEVEKILAFHPDRLGHCTCIHPLHSGSQELWLKLLNSYIPVELCLTSNVKCGTVDDYKKHHFIHLYSANHPVILAPFLREKYDLDARCPVFLKMASHFPKILLKYFFFYSI
ncbi:adenosine deaminase-like protein isoform X2 [Periplaneta americana]|uniref:adenosine deaminase-like protein isoform X2 n=1 Tax=Periplaneta americana TaxID=6978 RepID=UPI0037E7DFB7